MQKRIYPLVGASAIALVAAAGALAPAATAHNTHVEFSHASSVAPASVHPAKRGNCYSNMQNDAADAIVSQDFTDAGNDIYDSMGADNFAVKKTCKVAGINVIGAYFNGSGPADSETVTFYADDAGGVPGTVINTQTVMGSDNNGSFTIPLKTVALPPGSYWVSVQATMAFAVGGEWGWEVTSHQKQGIDGQWQNPGGGFGMCPTWDDVVTCTAATGPDFMMTLTK